MSDKSRQQHVIDKYRLHDTTDLETEIEGRRFGPGPIMSQETLNTFMRLDPSGNNKYLDWMIFIAGGGQDVLDRMICMWEGEGPEDSNSLRFQMRAEFIEERTSGYTENNVTYPPITRELALAAWPAHEPRFRFEFICGDQDIANEDGYGFFRDWPGNNESYQRIVNAITLWHESLPLLKSLNAKIARFNKLESQPPDSLTKEELDFIDENSGILGDPVELDIYAGWRPNELAQPKAVYKTLNDLLRSMADIRKTAVLRNVQFDTIYEDENVIAVCPLTIGASLKYGSVKWCTSNRSDFDRAFDPSGNSNGHWANYNARGPLVYLNWKCAMPEWLSKMAFHADDAARGFNPPWADLHLVTVQNLPGGVTFKDVSDTILMEAVRPRLPAAQGSKEDWSLRWPNRKPDSYAWTEKARGISVLRSLTRTMEAMRAWYPTFDRRRIIRSYVTEV